MAKRSRRKRKYSPSAGREVKNEMHRYKRGQGQERPGRQGRQGEEPQAGDRDRALEGAQEGQEGSEGEEVEPRECRCPTWAMTGIRVAAEMSRAQ
jgi:Family of unknown function (DUF6496)